MYSFPIKLWAISNMFSAMVDAGNNDLGSRREMERADGARSKRRLQALRAIEGAAEFDATGGS